MEIKITASELARALTILQGAVQKKSTSPILSNVLLQAHTKEACLHVSATDLDVGMRLKLGCSIVSEGASSVQARALLDVVKVLAGPDVTLQTAANGHLSIKSGRASARLLALNALEFPSLPSSYGVRFFELDSLQVLSMVHKTIYSTSTDENRYNLTGVLFEPQVDGSSLVMVSTDGHRLSRIKEIIEGGLEGVASVTLPRKGLSELVKLLDSSSDESRFKMGISEQHAIMLVGDSYLSMRLVDGKFPDYHQVIPKLADKILRVPRADLLLALKRVSVMTSEKSQTVRIKVSRDVLTLSCINPDAGEVTDDVGVEYNGPDMEIGFNAKYLMEALSSLLESNVMIKFTDPLSPTLITGTKEERHQCVIMPMRLQEM